MRLNDTSLGLLVLLAGAFVLASAFQFSAIPGQVYGADTMPKVIGASTLALGLFLVGRGVALGAARPDVALSSWARSRRSLINLALAIGLILAYVALSPTVGFVVAALVIQITLMLARGVRPLPAAAVALLSTLAIQQAFGKLMSVPLPRSPFLDFLW